MLFWALLVFSLRFSLPTGHWGREGNWTVWLVPVAVSPGPSAPSPIGVALSAASQPPDLRRHRLRYRSGLTLSGRPVRFAPGLHGGCRSRLVGIPSPPILLIVRGLRETRSGSARTEPPNPVSCQCLRRPVPKPSLAVLFCSPVPWRIAAVPPALGFP